MPKRKQSPLQVWRNQYAYLSQHIRYTKLALKPGVSGIRPTSKHARSLQQSLAALRRLATGMMLERDAAKAQAKAAWEAQNEAWEARQAASLTFTVMSASESPVLVKDLSSGE